MSSNPENKLYAAIPSNSIIPRAGLLRGVRLWADPDSILESPFEESGMMMGYVYVYGEEAPAVFDGTTWHSILSAGETVDPSDISEQYYKVIEHSKVNAQYLDIAQHITAANAY
jgi:hypothetical protein